MFRIRPRSAAVQTEEAHAGSTGTLSDFILGSQDGLVNVLGILLGLASAGQSRVVILIATLAALAAETISMGAVAYTSTRARRQLYLSEQRKEIWEMEHLPDAERQEVREILAKWGFEGEELEKLLDQIVAKPKAWLDLMMAFELHLAPVPESQPARSAMIVGLATVMGSLIPVIPFLVATDVVTAAIVAIVLSAGMLFAIGWYEARTTVGSVWRAGLRMLVIGLGAGLAGYLVGLGIHSAFGVYPRRLGMARTRRAPSAVARATRRSLVHVEADRESPLGAQGIPQEREPDLNAVQFDLHVALAVGQRLQHILDRALGVGRETCGGHGPFGGGPV
ncbi:MAG: VIT1/CCC1 transporter family protein, partial [Thermoplasmata archaeon]